jgi:hypothetical protein
MVNEVVALVLHAFVNLSVRLLVGLPGRAKQLILLGTVALTRFSAIVAHFGRFLPRLGPFASRTAFFWAVPNPPKIIDLCAGWAGSGYPDLRFSSCCVA